MASSGRTVEGESLFRLACLVMSEFWEQYKDPRWQRKRLEIQDRDGWMCRCCGASDKTLNVHHSYYERGRDVWDYPDYSYFTFCEDCHAKKHAAKPNILLCLSGLDEDDTETLLGFALSLLAKTGKWGFPLEESHISGVCALLSLGRSSAVTENVIEILFGMVGKRVEKTQLDFLADFDDPKTFDDDNRSKNG